MLKKIILFISSYFPLYIIIIIKYFRVLFNYNKLFSYRTVLILFLFFVTIACILSLFMLKKTNAEDDIEINKNIEMANDTVISYIMTYVIPIISTEADAASKVINIFLFLLIGYLYIKLNLIYINPLWAILGYLPYRNGDKIIVSDISYVDLRNYGSNNIKLKGSYITNDIVIVKKIENKEKIIN